MLNARERALVLTSSQPNGFDARSDGLNRLYGLGEYSSPIDARERALSSRRPPLRSRRASMPEATA